MPLSKIVVGVDFSPESDRAVDHAMALAHQTGAALVLVHVAWVPPRTTVRTEGSWLAHLTDHMALDRAKLGVLHERLSGQGVDVSQVVVDGDADEAVADAATALAADLIVVGTHGRSGIRRVLLGSVAEKTVRLARMSVLVARGPANPGGYRRVVVGTDYSPLAWQALARAFELTAPGGEVRVVNAWRAPYVELDLDGHIVENLRRAAALEASAARDQLLAMPRPPGVTVGLDVVDGAPFTALADLSESADLLVVGSHGRRGVRRFVLGSVAEATVRHASCTVLVAR